MPTRRASRLLAAIMLLAVGASMGSTGCSDNDQRDASLRAIARWEDRRLADPDSLDRFIQSPDAHVRLAAVRAAGLIGRSEALPAMIAALHDRSASIREAAAFGLGLLGDPDGLPHLQEAASDKHASLRLAALAGLAHLDHDGEVFYEPALHGSAREAMVAWNGLRNVAETADQQRLISHIRAGLSRPESEVVWRVLRCAERVPDSTLVAQIANFARQGDAQVRVHACRALGRHGGDEALAAILASCDANDDLHRRDQQRVRVAQLRAIGRLAGPTFAAEDAGGLNSRSGQVATVLISGAGAEDPSVVRTALDAMAAAVADITLPPQAAQQESLLPVWRIRMVRAAHDELTSKVAGVRAAAVAATIALRGPGGIPLVESVLTDPAAQVREAYLAGVAAHGDHAYRDAGIIYRQAREGHPPRIRVAALQALDRLWQRRDALARDDSARSLWIDATVFASYRAAMADDDFTVVTTTAPLLAHFPSGCSVDALLDAYRREWSATEAADVQLAVLTGLETVFASGQKDERRTVISYERWVRCTAVDQSIPDATLHAVFDSLLTAQEDSLLQSNLAITENHRARVATLLRRTFDAGDPRIRSRGREIALATKLLPAELIPSEASLQATLPAFVRSPAQPPVSLPCAAVVVRCVTDQGVFEIKLDPAIAPNTCANFLALIAGGFYEDASFHRVVPDFVIQGGCPRGDGWGGPGYTIRSEWSREPYERGTVGIAHSGKDTGGSQWFVCHSPQPHLNGRYTVFGRVTSGLKVVDLIQPGDGFRLELVED